MYYKILKRLGRAEIAKKYYLQVSGHLPPALHAWLTRTAVSAAIAGSGLFDVEYYRKQNPDVKGDDTTLLMHYVRRGAYEGRDPHPLFDSRYYLQQNPDIQRRRQNPLFHYCMFGAAEGRKPHPKFDTVYYNHHNRDVMQAGINPLHHFMLRGAYEGRRPNATFDPLAYLSQHPEVAAAHANPLVHFITEGQGYTKPTIAHKNAPSPKDASPLVSARVAKATQEECWADYAPMATRFKALRKERLEGFAIKTPDMIDVSEGQEAKFAQTLNVSATAQPTVSIIIPVYNQLRYTLEGIASIVKHTNDVAYEIIVIDDSSSDQTQAVLSAMLNLHYIRNDQNLGFLQSCNRAASMAKGDYIVFFNNDAQVQPGWLSALVKTFDDDKIGAVGPKILFPNGRLQEAGARINRDFTTRMIGLWDDATAARYNYARDVDYCSGACLMIRASLWKDIGGFDEALAPAYCEDVDLCLAVRNKGFRVVYQPKSVVVHHLSITSEKVDKSYKLRLAQRNQQKLAQKWKAKAADFDKVKMLAMYLPQFHPIPENNFHWGQGFTEWNGVSRARPAYGGHNQPRIPTDLGFYDLRLAEIMQQQFALAKRYGISGFCYYYYWFHGQRPLETPLQHLLTMPDALPFCLSWANENWTRKWDGEDQEVIFGQEYSAADDEALMKAWLPYLQHNSYIKVNGKPLILLYRMGLLPDIKSTLAIWRRVAHEAGIGEIYIAMMESFDLLKPGQTPQDYGFDASVEFAPAKFGVAMPVPTPLYNQEFDGRVFDYRATAERYVTKPLPNYPHFRGVTMNWDNTARQPLRGHIFENASPGAYQAWLETVIEDTRDQHHGDERLVFINAWNEWAEGTYLEPDERYGHAWLEATYNAQDDTSFAPEADISEVA